MKNARDLAIYISGMIQERGGSGHHVMAASVRLPASIFDELKREAEENFALWSNDGKVPSRGTDTHFKIHGLSFVRGATDAEILEQARRDLEPAKSGESRT
jgi:hypothetical protein